MFGIAQPFGEGALKKLQQEIWIDRAMQQRCLMTFGIRSVGGIQGIKDVERLDTVIFLDRFLIFELHIDFTPCKG